MFEFLNPYTLWNLGLFSIAIFSNLVKNKISRFLKLIGCGRYLTSLQFSIDI